jgi:hypothetical protein
MLTFPSWHAEGQGQAQVPVGAIQGKVTQGQAIEGPHQGGWRRPNNPAVL